MLSTENMIIFLPLFWGVYLHFRKQRDDSTERMMRLYANGFEARSNKIKLNEKPGNNEENIFGTFGLKDEDFKTYVICTGDKKGINMNGIYRRKMIEDKIGYMLEKPKIFKPMKILYAYFRVCWLYSRFKRSNRLRRGL